MSNFCANYTDPGTRDPQIWPQAVFPGNLFPGWDSKRRLTAQEAWRYYELVESSDAATRVRLGGTGWQPPQPSAFAQNPVIWYLMRSQADIIKYRLGLSLHQQACPNIDWRSQRSYGISASPVTSVYLSNY